MTDIPALGKFEGNISLSLSEYLYTLTLEGFIDENYGSVDESGWFGIIRNIDKPNTEAYIRQEFGTEPKINWHYIVSEDNQGFFSYSGFDDIDEVNTEWERIITNGS